MILPTISSRRLFGRDAELQLLTDSRRALSGRRGCTVLLGGEAGIGKSRLLREFTAGISGGRAPYYAFGEALEDAPRPFGPFRSALASLVLSSRYAWSNASPLVRRALAALIPDSVASRASTTAERMEKAEIFSGVLQYLTAVTEKRATIVALEDLHWADAATLELLCHLAPRIGRLRLMLIATYRDDAIGPRHRLFGPLARLARESSVQRVALEPLRPREVRALIDDVTGNSHVLPADAIRDVVERSDGNPFFAEEMLKRAIERERTGRSAPLPISLRALTLERIAMLSSQNRNILDYAAVLGMQFTAATLAAASGQRRNDVERALDHLLALAIVSQEEPTDAVLHFRHAITRQIIYEELPAGRAREMHTSILTALEAQTPDELDALAYHAWRAGLAERTLTYSELAGDAAVRVRASAQAATYYQRALELVVDDDARERLLQKSGEAWLQQSDFTRAVCAFTEACELLVERGDFDNAARALTRAAGEMANGGQIRKALDALVRFGSMHGKRLGAAAADHVQITLARIATTAADFDSARRALDAVGKPQELGAFSHQVYWLARLFLSEHELDLPGWKDAATALERRNPETYPLMRSQMLHSIASTAIVFGETAPGIRAVDAALAIDREFGFFRPLAYASAVKACLLGVGGRLDEARACIDAALAERDLFVVRLELALGAAPVALALGDSDLAERLLDDEAAALCAESGAASASLFDGMRAVLLFSFGRRREAQQLLEPSIDAPQHSFAVVHFWPLAARYADDARLARLLQLCAFDERPGHRVRRACAAMLRAHVASRAGNDGAHALTAATLYREIGWPLHEASALELAGDSGGALEIYRACGSIDDVRRMEMAMPAAPPVARDALSPRERQVATMVARGYTNRAIAEELRVTEKTIEKYVTSIYAKLGFSTRTQLAVHVARNAGG
ncbi:MAG: AAA family ATPase [Candidatus Eremiobacteraeota bacterium]|nr:AAA family ATPase [Candidatus Eremiobacteraeota bacterium]